MQLVHTFEIVVLLMGAIALSWVVRRTVRVAMPPRRAALRRTPGALAPTGAAGRGRPTSSVSRAGFQRADAAARMLSHFSTAVIGIAAAIGSLQILGVDPVYAISSAGFVGLAVALSGQDIIKNILSGTVAVLEDRYAVGDEVLVHAGGADVRGVVDLVGATSVRLRLSDGGTWYGGHSHLETVTNLSQRVATSEFEVPTSEWLEVGEDAPRRLLESSGDVGLTGVVFLPDLIELPDPTGRTRVEVRSNRPLTASQHREVERRLRAH